MKKFKYLYVLLLFFLTACGETDKTPVEKPVKDDHIMSGYMKALEEAEKAQEKTNESLERQEEAIDEATGNK